MAYFEDGTVHAIREANAASESEWIRQIARHPFRTALAVAHVRHATQGRPALVNTQPFVRSIAGRDHVFAHNGDLDRSALRDSFRLASHRPLGETDSEYAFCSLIAELEPLWRRSRPSLGARLDVVARFARGIRALGPANFLYTDGKYLFVHGHRRMHGAAGIVPPGLHMLRRECRQPGGRGGQRQAVLLFASVALTAEENWEPLAEGEIVVAREGEIVARVKDDAIPLASPAPVAAA